VVWRLNVLTAMLYKQATQRWRRALIAIGEGREDVSG
jgi:hypothetical protein